MAEEPGEAELGTRAGLPVLWSLTETRKHELCPRVSRAFNSQLRLVEAVNL